MDVREIFHITKLNNKSQEITWGAIAIHRAIAVKRVGRGVPGREATLGAGSLERSRRVGAHHVWPLTQSLHWRLHIQARLGLGRLCGAEGFVVLFHTDGVAAFGWGAVFGPAEGLSAWGFATGETILG